MPTLFESLGSISDSSTFSVDLAGQIGNLASVVDVVTNLINNPPDGLDGLMQLVGELPLPDFDLGDGLTSGFGAITAALPEDLGSVTGDITARLGDIESSVGNDISDIITSSLKAAMAIYQLTQLDWKCTVPGDSNAGGTADDSSGDAPGDAPVDTGDGASEPHESNVKSSFSNAGAMLDLLPQPVTLKSSLIALNGLIDKVSKLPVTLPVIDDLRDPLDVLVRFEEMDAAGVTASIEETFTDLSDFIREHNPKVFDPITTEMTAAITTHLPLTDLTRVADGISNGFADLKTAIDAENYGETTAIIAAIDPILSQFQTIKENLPENYAETLNSLEDKIEHFVDDLHDQMDHLVSVLGDNSLSDSLGPLLDQIKLTPDPRLMVKFEFVLDDIFKWINDLVDQIDLKAIQDPLSTVADALRSAVDALDDAMVTMTMAIGSAFGEVESAIDSIDTESLTDQVRQTLAEFRVELTSQMENLFAPVKDVISGLITEISGLVDGFDPDSVRQPLNDIFDSISGLLNDPAVSNALDQIQTTLSIVEQQISSISFAPVTDQVVDGIEGVTDALASIDTSQLDTMMEMALDAAVAVLPSDLNPVIDPLIDQMGEIIDDGPVKFISQVEDLPGQLLDKIREFDPSAIIGDALSEPFNTLLEQLSMFKPSELVGEPMEDLLDALKERLEQYANPGQLIEPLEPVFDNLKELIFRLKPGDLVQPLSDQINEIINKVIDAMPVDEIFEQIDKVLEIIQDVVDTGDVIKNTCEKALTVVDAFTDVESQLNSWADELVDKIDFSDAMALTTQLSTIALSIEQTLASGLTVQFNTHIQPSIDSLTDFAPDVKMAAMIQGFRRCQAAVNAIPGSIPEKAALVDLLGRANLLEENFMMPFQALTQLTQKLSATKTGFQTELINWDATYHGAESILADYQISGLSAAELKEKIREVLRTQLILPLSSLFSYTQIVRDGLSLIISKVNPLVTSLQVKITDLLLGPDSLGGMKTSMDELVQRLRDINFDFISDSLNEIFEQIESKLDEISPAQIRQIVETEFSNLLDALSVNLLIPEEDMNKLDSDFDDVIKKAEALNPDTLVVQPLQTIYDDQIVPLLDVFDISEVINALLTKIRNLDDELKEEMETVNIAYSAMLQAVP